MNAVAVGRRFEPAGIVGVGSYHHRMSTDHGAVSLHNGPLRLVFGDEEAITAMELVASGDTTRLEATEIGMLSPILQSAPEATDALFGLDVAQADRGLQAATKIDVHGRPASELVSSLDGVEETQRQLLLTRAALTAWRQRLSDAADAMPQLTSDEAAAFGSVDVTGQPLLTGLRAEQRRLLRARLSGEDVILGDQPAIGTAINETIDELFASLRFDIADACQAGEDELGKVVKNSLDRGHWADSLRLLTAAQEIQAVQCILTFDTPVDDSEAHDTGTRIGQAFAEYLMQRRQAADIGRLVGELADRLPDAPTNPVVRLQKRMYVRDVERLRELCLAYVLVTAATVVDTGGAPATWQQALDQLIEFDAIADDPNPGPTGRRSSSQRSGSTTMDADQTAELLGRIFANQLAPAKDLVAELRRQHPGVEDARLISIIKRNLTIQLQADLNGDMPAQTVVTTAARLAMSIVTVRGIAPHTESKFHAIGEGICHGATKIANAYSSAGTVQSAAFAGLAGLASYVQPVVVELVFNWMAIAKPNQAGPARDAFKMARSKVWRARHDKRVGAAAVAGMSGAVRKGMDAGAPRLIVRLVDRALR